jgi:branched-chain amino acid transport system permease protein
VIAVQWISDQADSIVAQQTPLILGIMLVVMVLVFPGGIVPALTAGLQKFRRGRRSGDRATEQASTEVPKTVQPLDAPHTKDSTPVPRGSLAALGVGKRFGGSVVLEDVTLEFGQHNIHAVVGPNGAGKSTLFGLLLGRHKVTQGRVKLNGIDVTRTPIHERARRGLGIKLQVPSIFHGLTVRQNISLALTAPRKHKQRPASEGAILETVGLLDKRDLLAANLSHGEQQWLEIGMLIAQNPPVMLFDEPAAGMTQDERQRTVELIRRLSADHLVIVVEHDMAFVRALEAPVVMLYRGGVFRHGNFDDLSNDAEVRTIYLGRRRDAQR